MLWRDRLRARGAGRALGLAVLLLAGATLAGCGFQPLYGEAAGGPVVAELTQIRVAPIADRSGQVLRNDLIQQLNPTGRPDTPAYVLNIGLSETTQQLAIRETDVATRANLVVTANYALTGNDGTRVTNGSVRTITSYNILRDEFATLSARRDALDRALRQISEDIRTRLALHFNRAD